jgi:hypothetical protein
MWNFKNSSAFRSKNASASSRQHQHRKNPEHSTIHRPQVQQPYSCHAQYAELVAGLLFSAAKWSCSGSWSSFESLFGVQLFLGVDAQLYSSCCLYAAMRSRCYLFHHEAPNEQCDIASEWFCIAIDHVHSHTDAKKKPKMCSVRSAAHDAAVTSCLKPNAQRLKKAGGCAHGR